MKNKKGVSLIVLVITIIVIIILAAAVILSLNNNNPIDNAKKATFDSDKDAISSAVSLYVGNYMAKNEGKSPFVNGGTAEEITISGKTETTRPAAGVNTLSWKDIGMTDLPTNMSSVTVNSHTGQVTCNPPV